MNSGRVAGWANVAWKDGRIAETADALNGGRTAGWANVASNDRRIAETADALPQKRTHFTRGNCIAPARTAFDEDDLNSTKMNRMYKNQIIAVKHMRSHEANVDGRTIKCIAQR